MPDDIRPENSRLEEENYFRERDRELLEAQRRAEAREAERTAIGAVFGIEDDATLVELQQLGYDAETVKVLPLLPLIRVAWAEGVVTAREREAILASAKASGLGNETVAYHKIQGWLEEPPSDPLYQPSLRLLGKILREGGSNAPRLQEIIADCTKVAAASGGFFGFGSSVSDVESAVIERIRKALDYDSQH